MYSLGTPFVSHDHPQQPELCEYSGPWSIYIYTHLACCPLCTITENCVKLHNEMCDMPALHLANLSLPHQLLSCCYTDFGQGAVEAESQGAAVAVIVATG